MLTCMLKKNHSQITVSYSFFKCFSWRHTDKPVITNCRRSMDVLISSPFDPWHSRKSWLTMKWNWRVPKKNTSSFIWNWFRFSQTDKAQTTLKSTVICKVCREKVRQQCTVGTDTELYECGWLQDFRNWIRARL